MARASLRNPLVVTPHDMVTHCTIRKSRLPEAAKAQITYESWRRPMAVPAAEA